MSKVATAVAITIPSVGPAIISIVGLNVPVAPFGLAMASLLLARSIAPASRRRLTKWQERCLTGLLAIFLLVTVSGQFTQDVPLKSGTAVIVGLGLGISGLLVVEFFGAVLMNALRTAVGGLAPPKSPEGDA